MKIIRNNFEYNKEYKDKTSLDLSYFEFPQNYRIKQIVSAELETSITNFVSCLQISLSLKGEAIVICNYSGKEFKYPYSLKDILSFADEESDISYKEDNEFDLDPYLIALIDNMIPLNLVKPGEKLPSSGEGYRVLTEDEYLKEKEKRKDPRWAALDDIEL